MVKIIRSFRFVYSVAEKIPGNLVVWQPRSLILTGKASISSEGPHPRFGSWWRIKFQKGVLPVDIAFESIIEEGTGMDILPVILREPGQYGDMFEALTELAREHNRGKFLS